MDYRQQILVALQAKFTGGNAGVLNWIATQLAKTVTAAEQVQTAVDGITQEYVTMMEGYGDSRATSSAQTAVGNYETKHGLKDGKPVQKSAPQSGQKTPPVTTPQPDNGGASNEVLELLKQLTEQNKGLTERLDRLDNERTTVSRKEQLSAVIGKLPETLRKPYERMALDGLSDEQFTSLVGEVTAEVDGILGDMRQKGTTFTPPAAPQGGKPVLATDAEVDAVIDQLHI